MLSLTTTPAHWFTLPIEEEEGLQRQIREALHYSRLNANPTANPTANTYVGPVPSDAYEAGFTVERLTEGRQRFKVWCTSDDDRANTGWYEAASGGYTPLEHENYFGPGIALASMGEAAKLMFRIYGVGIAFCVAMAWAWRRRRISPIKR